MQASPPFHRHESRPQLGPLWNRLHIVQGTRCPNGGDYAQQNDYHATDLRSIEHQKAVCMRQKVQFKVTQHWK